MRDEIRMMRLRQCGYWLTLLALTVVGVSAWLRLAGAGLGCSDWPACYAGFLNGMPYQVPPAGRIIHRVVATTALLLACYTCWISLKPSALQPVARQSIILLGLMLLLSVVGIWSNEPRRVLVNFINLLGGLALVSFSWRIVLATHFPGRAPARGQRRFLHISLLALTATVLIGALIGARYAAMTCESLPDCDGTWWPQVWSGFNPLEVMEASPKPAGVALHVAHRLCALLTLLLLGTAAFRCARSAGEGTATRRAATLVILLLTAEVLLGIWTVAGGYSLGVAIAHNIGAALLLAASAELAAAN